MFGLLKGELAGSRGYSGSDSYKYIDRLINDNGSVLKIVTPFLSSDYAKMLQKVAKRKRVYLLLSKSGSRTTEEAARLLSQGSRRINIKLLLAVLLIFFGTVALSLFLYSAISAVFLLFIFPFWLRKPATNLKMKMASGKFIHEKLYISDDDAIVGSANLTYAGTHRNVEHIEIIKNRERIDELSSHFDDMWSRY